MRRARPKPNVIYLTVADVRRVMRHYAQHVDQPTGPQHDLVHVDDETMDRQLHACDPATARGIPSSVNYKDDVIRVWPWPAEGWQVWVDRSPGNTPKVLDIR